MNLSTVGAMFDAVFPTLNPQKQAPLQSLASERDRADDAFVAEHIARRAPVLAREYAQNRAKVVLARLAVAQACAEAVGNGRADPITAALMAGDFAEAGRLEAVRVDALLLEQAKDAAELEAQAQLDAREIEP
jgi:hypothetical protein